MSTSTMWTNFQTPTRIVRASTGTDFAYRRMGDRGGIPLVLGNARGLRMMEMGDDVSYALGVRVERTRLLLMLAAAAAIVWLRYQRASLSPVH